ncbi:hypothetical protein ACFTXM_38300 [Streptomyces sp. NPDC056930]|uniref:hypothetical protein n=1 Tax=Streptomyces sp. NPDC056930 TaxID=3345967 RepID=UPI00363565F6
MASDTAGAAGRRSPVAPARLGVLHSTQALPDCEITGFPGIQPVRRRAASVGPVFAGNVLLGIARQIPRQRDGRRVECLPARR